MSRTADIPDNFMLKWQSETHRGTKPVRRPMTACQACRASKVKCDGKQTCGHCTSRGVACIYTKPKGAAASNIHNGNNGAIRKNSQNNQNAKTGGGEPLVMVSMPPPATAAPAEATLPTPSNVHTNPNTTAPGSDSHNELDSDASVSNHNAPYRADAWLDGVTASLAGQTPATVPYAVYDAWQPGLDMPLDLVSDVNCVSLPAIPDYRPDNLSSFPGGSDSDSSVHAAISGFDSHGPSSSTSTGSVFSSSSGSNGSVFSSASGGSNGSVFASANCACRDKLAESIDKLNNAMLTNKMDDVFHVTSEFMLSCQGIIDCRRCSVGCTDLVCLITFFQQTGTCFHYIAAVDPKQQTVKLQFGGTFVTVSDPRMRLMAVMNLVQQATDVLDALGNRGQTMLQALAQPTQLALTNIGYLEKTIHDIKLVLDRVVTLAKQSAGDSG